MEKLIKDFPIWVFAVVWFVLQLVQALFTPIHYDEAYYWMYSQQLDWGYFDHPPAVAFLIWLSDFIFNGILSVRFLSIGLQLFSFYLIWQTVPEARRQKLPFLLLIGCLPFFHILGWITTPDVPLLFSAALFFYRYKKVLNDGKILNYIFWGVSMAALIYSKYHGGLLILLVLFSNPKLFLNPKTYLAGMLGLALWSPHMYWQFQNDFPTFRYHLQERAGEAHWYYPLEYLGNLLVVINPFLIGFLYKLVKRKNEDAFERALYFTLIGFIGFFFIQSFRDHVQPQWLVLTYFPIILLLLLSWKPDWNRNLIRVFWISLPILLSFRILLMVDLLPMDLGIHRQGEKMNRIHTAANGLPVMFINSYKYASLYTWYTDQDYTHSYNTAFNRKNQFSIWNKSSIFNNQKVFLVGANYPTLKLKQYSDFNGAPHLYSDFEKISFDIAGPIDIQNEEILVYELVLNNPYDHPITIDQERFKVNYQFFDEKKRMGKLATLNIKSRNIPAHGTTMIPQVSIPIPKDKDGNLLPYTHLGFSLKNWPWPPASILKKFKIPAQD